MLDDLAAMKRQHFALLDCGSTGNARRSGTALHIAYRDPFFTGKRIGFRQLTAATIGKQEAARRTARPRNPLGPGKRQQCTCRNPVLSAGSIVSANLGGLLAGKLAGLVGTLTLLVS